MQTISYSPSPQMPGYRLNEYLLVLSPHEELRNRISRIKKDFQEKYQSSFTLSGRPHITLARFVTWNMAEEKLLHRLQHIAMGLPPFKVELRDFGSFPSHTIYINVTTKQPVQQLVKELKTAQRLMKAHKDFDPHFIQEPHLTIARKLLPWQYEKAWLEYAALPFTGRFIADDMLLLKRPLGANPYQVLSRLELKNMPVATRQGELFV
ncbi:MAG TPA: 2'-5' RNA ligase family protein [Flavitalea sp.]|nr:2'-5' RNA ligase family protein [Flavitalea sp.]